MPYPNFHSVRLRDPNDFKDVPDWAEEGKFRTKYGGKIFNRVEVPDNISIIYGQLKSQDGDETFPQALRFPKTSYTIEEVRDWVKTNKVRYVKLEEATEEKKKAATINFFIKDAKQQIVSSVVYAPMTEDTDGEGATEEEIEKAMVYFMKNGEGYNLNHTKTAVKPVLVENWITRIDFYAGAYYIAKGSWCQTHYIADKKLWKKIMSGEINGFSMEGTARSDQ